MQRIATLFGLIFLLAACGGGGGDTNGGENDPPVVGGAQDLFGTSMYWHVGTATKGAIPSLTSFIGDGSATSQNQLVFNDEVNTDGVLSQATIEADAVVEAPRELLVSSAVRAPVGRGTVSPGGRYALIGNDDPTAGMQLHALARKPETFTLAEAAGIYHFTLFSFTHTSGKYATIYGTASINNMGQLQLLGAQVNNGTELCPIPVAVEFDFTLGANGQIDITIVVLGNPTYDLRGGFAEGGDVAFFGGAVTDDKPAMIGALVRQSSAMPDDIALGNYQIAGYLNQTFSDFSFTGTAAFDATTASLDLTGSNGISTLTESSQTIYNVEPDGRMTLDLGGALYVGGMSPDGQVAFLSGPLTEGARPGFVALVRR